MNFYDILLARCLCCNSGEESGGGGGLEAEPLNVTENGTYTADEGKAFNPVTVNVSGGSSDFSTAQVTIVNNGSAECEGSAVYIASYPSGELLDSVFYVDAGNSDTLTCVLYKGLTPLDVNGWQVTVEGDAEIDGFFVIITGNCTITLTDAA